MATLRGRAGANPPGASGDSSGFAGGAGECYGEDSAGQKIISDAKENQRPYPGFEKCRVQRVIGWRKGFASKIHSSQICRRGNRQRSIRG